VEVVGELQVLSKCCEICPTRVAHFWTSLARTAFSRASPSIIPFWNCSHFISSLGCELRAGAGGHWPSKLLRISS
jgi:hypothetical protein